MSFDDPKKAKLWKQLDAVREDLLNFARGLSADDLTQPVTEIWSVKDVLAHLASAEAGHVQVGQALVRAEPTQIPGFVLDEHNQREVEARRRASLEEILTELSSVRESTRGFLESVQPDDWEKAGLHVGGFETDVFRLFKVIAIHERRHLNEARAALKSENGSW